MADDKWLVEGPKVIDLGPIRNLKVALVRGQVDIVGHDEPTTRVEVHSVSGKELRITLEGDSLEIDHPQLRWDNFIDVFRSFSGTARADVSILVPRDVALKFGVVSSTGLISGLSSDASISTVNGDLVIDDMHGEITLNSVSGELAVRNQVGKVTAHTVSGDLTVSGDVPRLRADGVNSDVFLDLKGDQDEIRLNTVSGNITTRLAGEQAAVYSINTVAGRIQLDDSEITGVRGTYNGTYGKPEHSWLDFRANTVSGNIAVLHVKEESPAKPTTHGKP